MTHAHSRSPYWRTSTKRAPIPTVPLTPAQRALAADNIELVGWVLGRHFRAHCRYDHTRHVLRAAGYYALCLAAQRYTPAHGAFTTFATQTIWGTINNERRAYAHALHHNGCAAELARTGAEPVDPLAVEPIDATATAELLSLLADAIRYLDPLDAEIVRRRYGLAPHREHTLRETGRAVGITGERVRQRLKERIVPRLRQILTRRARPWGWEGTSV